MKLIYKKLFVKPIYKSYDFTDTDLAMIAPFPFFFFLFLI